MSLSKQITAPAAQRGTNTHPVWIVTELLIWNAAYREYCQLQKLDADALRDMGMTEASRASVTVTQIAARMRA